MLRILVVASLFVCMGCGRSGPTPVALYAVKGKVAVNGRLLTKCSINLSTESPPMGGDGQFSGKMNDSGEFNITTETGNSGALAANYKITFLLPPNDAKKVMMIPGDSRPVCCLRS